MCGGRGTCAARYYDSGVGYLDVYSHLECVCAKPAGVLDEFPKWSGDKCQRAVDAEGQTARREVEGVEQYWCAEGFFGPECDLTCPSTSESDSWGGAGARDSRGKCVYDETHPEQSEMRVRPGRSSGRHRFFRGGELQRLLAELLRSQLPVVPRAQSHRQRHGVRRVPGVDHSVQRQLL